MFLENFLFSSYFFIVHGWIHWHLDCSFYFIIFVFFLFSCFFFCFHFFMFIWVFFFKIKPKIWKKKKRFMIYLFFWFLSSSYFPLLFIIESILLFFKEFYYNFFFLTTINRWNFLEITFGVNFLNKFPYFYEIFSVFKTRTFIFFL